ncbi:hypothetical protein C8R43DRAFT_1170326 [Mycena crocata]|nr:hypothetical protein C8R43DRAFT_1170326 [Mycena crocata]
MSFFDDDIVDQSAHLLSLATHLGSAVGLAGVGIMTSVLLAFTFVAWHPTSRPHMNRVSLRLVVYALIANIIYTSMLLPSQHFTGPSTACTFVAFGTITSLMFSAAMFFCVSLNLQLVLVHGLDGRKMEKYYVMGTCFLCLVCSITPLAAGQLGFNSGGFCWFANPNPTIVLRWAIGTSNFWLLLLASGELVSFVVLASFMARNQSRATRVLSNATVTLQRHRSTPPILQYRGIILRIGEPLILIPFADPHLNGSQDCTHAAHASSTSLEPLWTFTWRVTRRPHYTFSECSSLTPAYSRSVVASMVSLSFLRAVRVLWNRRSQEIASSHSQQSQSTHISGGSNTVGLERKMERQSEETGGPSGDAGARGSKAEVHADLEPGSPRQEGTGRMAKRDDGITCQF